MNARSALFDLYGDHLLPRGGQAPVAALVRLLGPLDISSAAVRTAVSRMARQGWLVAVRLPGGAGYRLTPRAVQRLEQAADRIYRHAVPPWDGRWHVVVVERIADRARRDRFRAALRYLGYAGLEGGATWISPRASVELEPLLAAEKVRAERFYARHDGDDAGFVARVWDIDGLARAYRGWLAMVPSVTAEAVNAPDDRVFAARSRLVHEWRKFLFDDPGLPAELLPQPWPGTEAAELFHAEAARLLPAATRFVDRCLSQR